MFRGETEAESPYRHIEKQTTMQNLIHISDEDMKVAPAVRKALPQIAQLVDAFVTLRTVVGDARLFYLGTGSSGRYGVNDASECPPTFNADFFIGIIAGGDGALRKAVEGAEDDRSLGWKDLLAYGVTSADMVIGLAASGRTPYVLGALEQCIQHKITTGCITCSRGSPIIGVSDYPVVIPVGPEFLTGSTRMKAGTAQKMALNMISTTIMAHLGGIHDNRMSRMSESNEKLKDRAVRNVMATANVDKSEALKRLASLGLEAAMRS